MRRLLIVGAGGHGRSVAEAALLSGKYEVVGFLDDAFPRLNKVWDFPVLGKTADVELCRDRADVAVVAVGNNSLRAALFEKLEAAGLVLATVIHPAAMVSPRAVVAAGGAIMAGAVIGTEARLGRGVIVNCGAVVDHQCQIGDFAHLGVRAAMAGCAELGRACWMQAGAVLGYGVKLGDEVVLAAGEAVNQC